MPQKLTTTACFIQEESSGGKQKMERSRMMEHSFFRQIPRVADLANHITSGIFT